LTLAVHEVFGALADPTRQTLLEWLSSEGSGTATEYARRLPISRQAVSRHFVELESAGLVSSSRVGRETRYRLEKEPLDEAAEWLTQRARLWNDALERLRSHLESS
jgi:DNA-binding transcriptional ArsR family regulator